MHPKFRFHRTRVRPGRFLAILLGVALGLALVPGTVLATDFALLAREPGPGHRLRSYWWHFNGASWELTPPAGFILTGGGEIHLSKDDLPSVSLRCRAATAREAALVGLDDDKARAEYVRTLLPAGVKNVRLEGQQKNPLPVNGLTNFSVTYTFDLGGSTSRLTAMVSQGGERDEQVPPVPGRPTPPPTPAPKPGADGKPVRTGECFTMLLSGPAASCEAVSSGFDQLMAGAKVLPQETPSDTDLQYSSHGMLGR